MAFRLGDRARETSTAPGSGSFTVNGAVQGAQSLASVLTANADTSWYFATNGTAWEVGPLTRTSATVYARGTPFASSNGGALVNFSSGLVDIVLDLPASVLDALNLLEIIVAAAATADLGAVQGKYVELQGTTGITSFGTSKNKERVVRYTGAGLTLTHSATLVCPQAVDLKLATGDIFIAKSDNTATPIWRIVDKYRAVGAVRTTTVQTSGSGTYTTPQGCVALRIRLIGGGGGGTGGGTSPGTAGTGGNTTFGTLTGSGAAAAAGGAASGGDVNITGGSGCFATIVTTATGGFGASSPFGGGGQAIAFGNAGQAPPANSGAGGGGGGTNGSSSLGGQGGGAGGYVEKLIVVPSATYSYAVGAAGSAGTAGTNGLAGGAGAAGLLIVEEFY